MKIKNKGFSFTEIIITILIIVVLSSISGPIYNSYSTKTKQAEGYLLLGTIKDAQMKYFQTAGSFWGYSASYKGLMTCNATELGIDARANKYYTKFQVGGNVGLNRQHNPRYEFWAVAYARDAECVDLWYNITTGTTMFSGVSEAW